MRAQQGNPKDRIKRKIKSVHSGYRDLEIGIKGVSNTREFTVQFLNPRVKK